MFHPKRASGTTDREIIMELLKAHNYGDMITYASFEEALGAELDRPVTRMEIQRAVNSSLPAIRMNLKKNLEAIPNIGYMIVMPERQVTVQVDKKREKIFRQVQASVSISRDTEESLLSDEAKNYRAYALAHAASLEVNIRLEDKRAKRLGQFFRGDL